MAASSGCKMLDKLNAKRLIDSVDTVLTDCDGIYVCAVGILLLNVKKIGRLGRSLYRLCKGVCPSSTRV